MKQVIVFISSEQKGFLIALSNELRINYSLNVVIVARDQGVKKIIDQLLPEFPNVVLLSDYSININVNNVMEEAIKIEENYNVRLNILMSEDRALGQGYLTNVSRIPDIIRASFNYKTKLISIVKEFKVIEKISTNSGFVIKIWPNKLVSSICKSRGIKTLSFAPIKFGTRMFWSDNDYITSTSYIERLNIFANIDQTINQEVAKYEIDIDADVFNKSVSFSYFDAIKRSLKIIFSDTQSRIRNKNKRNSYRYLGWTPSIFRSVSNWKFIVKNSKTINDVKDFKLVFFALHLEPEVALQSFSPEFNNSMEAIIWISKSLPVNYIIVVKEQVLSYGIRSRWFYKQLIKLPNVVIAHPDIHSWEWINEADIVATITGTVGQEAVHFKKPVISFGKHQIINFLSTVFYVTNYFEVKSVIDDLIINPLEREKLLNNSIAFRRAQIETSIDSPNYMYAYDSIKLETQMAKDALDNLFEEYPELVESESPEGL